MKIQLKRSNVLESGLAKQPTAGQMEYGEIAVNYNNNDPVLFIKNSADEIIRIAGAGSLGSFSGDYNDLTNQPTIGDGTLTVKDADGATVATFTANQEGPTELNLPAGFSGDYGDLDNAPDLSALDTALQPGDNISELNNDAGYITTGEVPSGAWTDDGLGNLYPETLTNKVGINIATPSVELEVNGSAKVTNLEVVATVTAAVFDLESLPSITTA